MRGRPCSRLDPAHHPSSPSVRESRSQMRAAELIKRQLCGRSCDCSCALVRSRRQRRRRRRSTERQKKKVRRRDGRGWWWETGSLSRWTWIKAAASSTRIRHRRRHVDPHPLIQTLSSSSHQLSLPHSLLAQRPGSAEHISKASCSDSSFSPKSSHHEELCHCSELRIREI